MLLIGCPKPQIVIAIIDKQNIEGTEFKVENMNGLSLLVSSDTDDKSAKEILKRRLKDCKELSGMYFSVQICDEKGRLK